MCSIAVEASEPVPIDNWQTPVGTDPVQPGRVQRAAGMSSGTRAQQWFQKALRVLQQRISDPQQLLREYQHIAVMDDSISHTTRVAKGRAAQGCNRYCNVLPFDHNRVKLSGDQEYINASHITMQLPSLKRPCRYIAAQGPLPATVADFWRMVYELKVPAVVMLTNVLEHGVNKCAQYYPAQESGTFSLPDFSLQVEQVVPFSADCTLRVMRLCPNTSDDSHLLSHYHFHAWPDHGTPDSSAGLRAVCRSLSTARESGGPVLVHCSAGIGRTGTFCAVDILLQWFDHWQECSAEAAGPDDAEVEAAVGVPNLVHKLRGQRMGMVQTLDQYAFIYQAIVDDLEARTANSAAANTHAATTTSSQASDADD